MTTVQLLELLAAAAMLAGAVWLYRRRMTDGSRTGSQGAVFLLLIAAIVGMHGLGLFQYRPSQAEIDRGSVPRIPR